MDTMLEAIDHDQVFGSAHRGLFPRVRGTVLPRRGVVILAAPVCHTRSTWSLQSSRRATGRFRRGHRGLATSRAFCRPPTRRRSPAWAATSFAGEAAYAAHGTCRERFLGGCASLGRVGLGLKPILQRVGVTPSGGFFSRLFRLKPELQQGRRSGIRACWRRPPVRPRGCPAGGALPGRSNSG